MEISNSAAGRGPSPGRSGSFAIGVLLIALVTSCAAFQPLVETDAYEAEGGLHTYENNLIHWNVLSVRHDTMGPIPPPDPAHSDALAAHTAAMNRLFRIAFDIVTAESSVEATYSTGNAPDPMKRIRKHADGRVVTIYFGQDDGDDEPPHVRGIVLSDTGWVLTVRHPFESRACTPDHAHIRAPGGETAYPIVSCRSGSGQNVMLAKFDVGESAESIEPDSPPPFSIPRVSETAYLSVGPDTIPVEITEIGVPLQIGSDLVYEGNFIADAPESIDAAVSGTPVWNRFGEIIGLYYHRSTDSSTVGFAALSDLPRQIGEAVRAVHREVSRERR